MLNHYIKAASEFGQQTSRPAGQAAAIRDMAGNFLTAAHHTLMFFGIGALVALGFLFVKPELADHIKVLSPFSGSIAEKPLVSDAPSMNDLLDIIPKPATPADRTPSDVSLSSVEIGTIPGTPRQQQWVTEWLSKRYRVATDATNMLVSAAYLTASETKLDPLLILAVMAIESGFNPFAESPVGAQGLMQVMSKVHREKFEELGGVKAALNPVANIKVGSLILKDYVTRGGSIEAGLKLYVGAAGFESDFGYGARVLAEYRRLQAVSAGKKVSIYSTAASALPAKPSRATGKPAALEEKKTTAAAHSGTTQDKTGLLAAAS